TSAVDVPGDAARRRMKYWEIIADIKSSENGKRPSRFFEIALVLVRLDQVASGIVNADLRGFGHASESPMHHEQYGRRMKAPEPAAMLVEGAQCLMRESRKLLEQRGRN